MKNMLKKVLPILAVVAALSLMVVVARLEPQNPVVPIDRSKGVLRSYVDYAKKNKQTQIVVPNTSSVLYPQSMGISDFVSVTVVEARVIGQITENHVNKLVTYNKFRILTTLNSPTKVTTFPAPLPKGVALNRGEFVLTTEGGTAVIDGVRLTQNKTPEIGKDYLIFMLLFPNGMAMPVDGPGGLFEIQQDSLKPFGGRDTAYTRLIKSHGNNLASVKAGLKQKKD